MPEKRNQDPLARAAAETLKRLRRYRRLAHKNLRPVIAHIEKHLFDSAFDVNALRKACRLKSNDTMRELSDVVGETAHKFITLCRLEVAANLLRHSRLTVKEIAALVGYEDARTFTRAFGRFYAEPPIEYRARWQQEGSALVGRNLESVETWRLGHAGKLALHEAVALIEHFQRIYGLEPVTTVLEMPIDGPTFERFLADRAWMALKDQPLAAQQSMLRSMRRFTTPALFDLLREKSREVGREDRRRGVQLSELAIASLESCADAFGDRIADLKARGWAWLGNARRLALDFAGAEDALALAEAAWATPRPKKDAVVEGEIYLYGACLRLHQRRFDEAMELANRAISLFRAEEAESLLAQALIIRSNINGFSGNTNACIPDLEDAIRVLSDLDEPFVQLSAYMNLATASVLLRRYDLVSEILPTARRLCTIVNSRLVSHQLQWVEALARVGKGETEAAEALLKRARSGLLEIQESDYAATAALDLAAIYRRQDRHGDATALASEVNPIFEGLDIPAEAGRPGSLAGWA